VFPLEQDFWYNGSEMKKPLTKQYLMTRVAIIEETACWEWTGCLHRTGYGELRREGKRILAHRLSYFLWNGEWPEICRHRCDNRKCCNPDHLEDGTHADNVNDRDSRGRGKWVRGEAHPRFKVTMEMMEEVRFLRGEGMTQQAIADSVGISQKMVSNILRGTTWLEAAPSKKERLI
jgi:predicted XRE-type DNA-binding protein